MHVEHDKTGLTSELAPADVLQLSVGRLSRRQLGVIATKWSDFRAAVARLPRYQR
jgi:hypothetical protein